MERPEQIVARSGGQHPFMQRRHRALLHKAPVAITAAQRRLAIEHIPDNRVTERAIAAIATDFVRIIIDDNGFERLRDHGQPFMRDMRLTIVSAMRK